MTVCGELHLLLIRNVKQFYLESGDKSGMSEKQFYKQLIKKADERFDDHLAQLKKLYEKEEEENQ
jgi:hypothetical protein